MMPNSNDAANRIPDGLGPLDGRPGPARPLSPERAAALVGAALDRAERTARAPSRRKLLLVAAAVVALASVAAAAGLYVTLAGSGGERVPNKASVPAPAAAPAAPATVTATPPASGGLTDIRGIAAPPAPPEISAPALAPPVPAAPPPPVVTVGPPSLRPAPPPDAEDLLLRANRLRAEREWAEAERTYARVLGVAPGSDAAYTAAVAAAALRLERLDQPRAALALYESVLAKRPRGTLAEEAAFGVAECQRTLGDAGAEAQALRRFLADWPAALMAGRARARLEDLESTTVP